MEPVYPFQTSSCYVYTIHVQSTIGTEKVLKYIRLQKKKKRQYYQIFTVCKQLLIHEVVIQHGKGEGQSQKSHFKTRLYFPTWVERRSIKLTQEGREMKVEKTQIIKS